MKTKFAIALALSAATLGCTSMARDAGMQQINDALRERMQQSVEWQRTVSSTDDPRVGELLRQPLDADRAVAVAMTNNPRLQVILADAGIAQAELADASTVQNPIVELETRTGGPYRPYEIRLAQSLFELIQLPHRRRLARIGYETARLRITAEVMRFAGEVRDSYYELVAATQHVAMASNVVETARTSTELAVRQHTAGNITDLDLENEQAVYEQAKLDLTRAEEELVLARESFVRELGLRSLNPPPSIVTDFPPLPENEMSDDDLTRLATTRRLDIDIARSDVEAARRAAPLRRMQALGEVVADVHRQREPEGTITTGPGIEFPLPIFNRGRAARLRAEAELLRAQQQLAAVTIAAGSEIRAAHARLATARARVEYYRDIVVPRRERIVELTKLEQNSMLVGVYQLLQARQNEAMARREYVEAQRDYWTARTDLDRALNGTADFDFLRARGSDERRSTTLDARGRH